MKKQSYSRKSDEHSREWSQARKKPSLLSAKQWQLAMKGIERRSRLEIVLRKLIRKGGAPLLLLYSLIGEGHAFELDETGRLWVFVD
jgi:hypothetical protein